MRKSKNLGAWDGGAFVGRADQNARARRYEPAFPSPTGSLDSAGNRSLFPGCLPRSGSYSYAPYACRPPTVLLHRVAFLPPRFFVDTSPSFRQPKVVARPSRITTRSAFQSRG